MKMLPFLSAIVASAVVSSASAQTIAQWTFETSPPASLTDSATISGILADVGTGTASGFHASPNTDWSTPSGNGSDNSLSANTWDVGDYFQFSLGTVGYSGIGVSWDQTSSVTGPRDFTLQYSTDGSTYTDFASYLVQPNASPNPTWNPNTGSSLYSYSFDLSAVPVLDNAANVSFRLIDVSTVSSSGGTVAASGTDRVDNFTVYAVPEPSGLATIGGLMLLVCRNWLRRR